MTTHLQLPLKEDQMSHNRKQQESDRTRTLNARRDIVAIIILIVWTMGWLIRSSMSANPTRGGYRVTVFYATDRRPVQTSRAQLHRGDHARFQQRSPGAAGGAAQAQKD